MNIFPSPSYKICHLKCFSLWILLWITRPVVIGQIKCASFHFDPPVINNRLLSVLETTRISLTFRLNNSCINLQHSDSRTISIGTMDKSNNGYTPKCNIVEINGKCSDPSSPDISCTCLGGGKYLLIKVITRSDDANWRWSTGDKFVTDATITFDVLQLTRIHNLYVDGNEDEGPHFVSRDSQVTIVCSWNKGIPPRPVYLLESNGHRKNNVLHNESEAEIIRFQMSNIPCHDATIVTCASENSEKNQSTTLVAKCPPAFRKVKSTFYNVSNGADANLHISMRAHDTNLKICQISKYNNQLSTPAVADHFAPPIEVQSTTISSHCAIHDNTREHEAVKCQCRVTGIPPELELNVQIHNVTRSIGGHWYGTVSNAFGSGYFQFDIHINIELVLQTSTPGSLPAADNKGENSVIIGLAMLSVVAILIAVITGIVKRMWLKESRERTIVRPKTKDFDNEEPRPVEPVRPCVSMTNFVPPTQLVTNTGHAPFAETHQACHMSTGADSVAKCLCQKADFMQVVYFIKGQQCNPCVPEHCNAGYLTPCASQYSTLNPRNNGGPRDSQQYTQITEQDGIQCELNPSPEYYLQSVLESVDKPQPADTVETNADIDITYDKDTSSSIPKVLNACTSRAVNQYADVGISDDSNYSFIA